MSIDGHHLSMELKMPASADENHCVNCAYDGLKQYRTLCLHPRQDEPGFWAPTPDNRCPFFEKAGNVMAFCAATNSTKDNATVIGREPSGGVELRGEL